MNRPARCNPVQCVIVLLLAFAASAILQAETVATLPAPSGYVNDFAGVLNPATKQNLEDLCAAVDRQAHAQIAVVTIDALDNGQTIEEFSTELEDKWKVGKKGTDEGLLMVVVTQSRKIRIEVGYGLEGVLNDAKVGAILDQMEPSLHVNDFNRAIPIGVNVLAQDIAANAGVALTVPQRRYRRVPAQQRPLSGIAQLAIAIGVIVLVIILISTGNIGWLFLLLNMFMGGGGGGGRDDDDRGGGFGGFGGGSSGGGGASRDF